MSDLFRQEVIDERRNRLHGHVILRLPLSTRMLVAMLTLCILIAGAWVATAEYARTQKVRGLLVTSKASVKIFPQKAGRVEQFALREGQHVNAGDLLAVINTDIVTEGGVSTAESSGRSVNARLTLATERAQMSRANSQSERTKLTTQITSLTRQIGILRDQIAFQRQIVASNTLMFDRMKKVIDEGFVSQFEYERRRQNMLSSQQTLANLEQNLDKMESDREAAQVELPRLTLQMQRDLGEIQDSVAELDVERARFAGERSYVIRAPISGRVTAIQTAQGRQASGQTPLFVLLPEGTELRARLYAPTAAIGMVEPGQKTALLLDAFPYQRFGSAQGKITEVSRTVLDPRDADVPFKIEEPVYQIDVALDKQAMAAFGKTIPLQPGMTLAANIVLERQTFLDWLLTPLKAVINRS